MHSTQATRAQSARTRILIVDDHDLVRDGIASLLRSHWEICGEATNGIDAVEQVRALKPDLVLLDVSMPGLGGLQAAKMIRKIAPSTKIVFISIHDAPTVRELVRVVGADGFVSKRSRAEELRKAVADLLSDSANSELSVRKDEATGSQIPFAWSCPVCGVSGTVQAEENVEAGVETIRANHKSLSPDCPNSHGLTLL